MQKLIVGNLKMNMENVSQRDTYCKEYAEEIAKLKMKHEVVICPPVIYLEYFCRTLGHMTKIGTQDCFWELYGSYTGNTSPKSIVSLGAKYVIIGHSEHREFNHETDEEVAKKAKIALRVGLTPIVCVGFLSHNDEMESVREQVNAVAEKLDAEEIVKTVFAYEPVWAIGSGKTPTSDEIHTVIMFMRSIFVHQYGKEITSKIKILYGGSVVAENVADVCTKAYTDGVLVGHASLSPENFIRIVRMLN
jgi:triosephosphate isomerase